MDYVWQFLFEPSYYRKSGLFNELEYSIRSVKKNAPPGRYFVVGDKPRVSHEDVIHIPVEPCLLGNSVIERHCSDTHNKMKTMAYSEEIGDEFVLMCDDNFIMQPTTVEDLKINWAKAEVKSIDMYLKSPFRTGTLTYRKTWRASYETIKVMRDIKGEKTYDWETHTPRYIVKAKLKHIIDTINFSGSSLQVLGMYDGFYADNTQIITPEVQSDLWTYTPGMDMEALLDKQYLNISDGAITPKFINIMEEKFGKCS